MIRTQHRTRKARKYRCRVDVDGGSRGPRWYWLCALLLALAASLTFVWLRSERERKSRMVQRLRREFALTAKELENLRMELEQYRSGTYILPAVEKLGLGLRPPLPGQVRRMSRPPTSEGTRLYPRSLVARK